MSARDRAPQDVTSSRASAPRPASARMHRPVFDARRDDDLAKGTATQTAMLHHIQTRLSDLRARADTERAAETPSATRNTRHDPADRHDVQAGWKTPDDARYKPLARLYEAAAQAAARGDLVQAARRLNEASEAEDRLREDTSRHVLPDDAQRRDPSPAHPWSEGVQGRVRTPVAVPAAIRAAVDDLTGRTPPSARPWRHALDRRRPAEAADTEGQEDGDAGHGR
ncbi:MAG: hypothetical protein RLZZ383_1071 [Pseudomonadota bacterium]